MIDAALIVVSAVLFNCLGLADKLFDTEQNIVLNCPKCLSFWTVLLDFFVSGYGLITSIGAAFISAYAALWLALLVNYLNKKYNEFENEIHQT